MKLTFKDLKQQKFVVEAEPSDTITQVKAKIQESQGWEPSTLKLIYSGKVLQDDKTVESYNIEEKGFIVCMTQKPKPVPSTSALSSVAPPSTPAQAPAPSTPAAPAPLESTSSAPASNVPATPTPAPQPSSPSVDRRFDDPSSLALGEERNNAIADMESMGFARSDIDRAMRAAFNNPDRAVEYLLTGIPDHLQREEAPARAAPQARSAAPAATAAAAAPTAPAPATTAPPTAAADTEEPINLFEAAAQAARPSTRTAATGAAAGATGTLDYLRNNPQFQQLRQVVQQQPQMLEPILHQLAQGNPELAARISQSPEEFLALLSEDADDDAALPPGAQAISVTEEEREAIERLCRLGFERDLVIQAYFACDKNEELAANFLFDQPEDEGEQ